MATGGNAAPLGVRSPTAPSPVMQAAADKAAGRSPGAATPLRQEAPTAVIGSPVQHVVDTRTSSPEGLQEVLRIARSAGASEETLKLLASDAAKAAEALPADKRPLGARYDSARAKVAKATSKLSACTERVRVAVEEQEAADAALFQARQQLAAVEAEVAQAPGPDLRIPAAQAHEVEQLLLAIATGTLGPEDATKAAALAGGFRGRPAEERAEEGENDTDMEEVAVDAAAEAQEARAAAEQSLRRSASSAAAEPDAHSDQGTVGADARRHGGSRTPPRQRPGQQAGAAKE